MEPWDDPGDRLLAETIFGTQDAHVAKDLILDWLSTHGWRGGRVLSAEFSVGAVLTVGLPDGSSIVVKAWPGGSDGTALSAQSRLQGAMAACGFPAPAVLTDLARVGPAWAVVMAYDRSGSPTDARIPAVQRIMAKGLARLMAEAECARGDLDLPRRALPEAGVIWPAPHNAFFDFEATVRGAEWIDEIASQALRVMHGASASVVVGHHDWSAKNMRIGPQGLAVVYDWDSVFLDRETSVVGAAAAHFPMTWDLPVPVTPAVEEVSAFVRDCDADRASPFTPAELAEIAAAATYARAYKARCEHALDPASVD